jgi:glycosyltransferase involved in cell wall biosynthesis
MFQMTHTIVYYVDGSTFGGVEQVLVSLLSRLDRTRWKPVLFHHPGAGVDPLVAEARRLDIKTIAVARMKNAGAILNFYPFVRALRMEKPTIFHAHLNWLLSCKFGVMAAAVARVPVVISTLHNFLLPPWRSNIYWQQRLVSANVHQYTAVSQAVARQLTDSFDVPSSKVKVLYNGIPLLPFDQLAGIKQTDGTRHPIVLTVARLDTQKGHTFLLDAIAQVPDANFILAGSGAEKEALEAKARNLGISDRVIFMGHRSDIPDLLANCDLFVLPSLYEGFPLSVLEAMAAGKPVVATTVSGTPEAVLDGVTGYLVPPGNPVALANAIRNVLSDLPRASQMGLAGKRRAQELFSVEAMVQRYDQVYAELVGEGRRIQHD